MADFCSILTGLAPYLRMDVCQAWVRQEGGPSDNPLNIGPGAHFGSIQDAASATAQFLQGSNYNGIRASGGQSAQAQISAIGNSPWDECRYTGGSLSIGCRQSCSTPGCTLQAIYASMFGSGGGSGIGSVPLLGGLWGVISGGAGAVGSGADKAGQAAAGFTQPAANEIVSDVKSPFDLAGKIGNAIDCVSNPGACAKATASGWIAAILPWVLILGIGFAALFFIAHEMESGKFISPQPAGKGS